MDVTITLSIYILTAARAEDTAGAFYLESLLGIED